MKRKFYSVLLFTLPLIAVIKTHAQANTNLSNLASPTAINQDLLPSAGKLRSVGTASRGWNYIYIDTALFLGGARFLSAPARNNPAVGNSVLLSSTGAANPGVG